MSHDFCLFAFKISHKIAFLVYGILPFYLSTFFGLVARPKKAFAILLMLGEHLANDFSQWSLIN